MARLSPLRVHNNKKDPETTPPQDPSSYCHLKFSSINQVRSSPQSIKSGSRLNRRSQTLSPQSMKLNVLRNEKFFFHVSFFHSSTQLSTQLSIQVNYSLIPDTALQTPFNRHSPTRRTPHQTPHKPSRNPIHSHLQPTFSPYFTFPSPPCKPPIIQTVQNPLPM